MFRIIYRTPAEKTDLAGSWARPDEDFFAAGACHILAGVFLENYPDPGFHALMLQPAEGFQGGHVIVTNGLRVFDCRGWHDREEFLHRYTESCRVAQPGWSCTLAAIADPLGWDFCTAHTHRHASQFFRDPLPRAKAFLLKFPPPLWPSYVRSPPSPSLPPRATAFAPARRRWRCVPGRRTRCRCAIC